MTRARVHPARAGLTLLETLLVTALLALVAAFGVGALAASGQAADTQRAQAVVREAIARAQTAARFAGGATLVHEHPRLHIQADGEAIAVRSLPSGWAVTFSIGHEAAHEIRFDARGRAPDFVCELAHPERPTASLIWHVHGGTGWITPEPEGSR